MQAVGRLSTLQALALQLDSFNCPAGPVRSLAFLAPLTRLTLLKSLDLRLPAGNKQLPAGLPGSFPALTELHISTSGDALLPVRLHAPGQGGASSPSPPRLRRLALVNCVLEGSKAATAPALQGLERLSLDLTCTPRWLAVALPALGGLTALTLVSHVSPEADADQVAAEEALLGAALRCGVLRELKLLMYGRTSFPPELPPGGLPRLQHLQLGLRSESVLPLWRLPQLRCLNRVFSHFFGMAR